MSFGIASNVPISQYKTPSGEEIQSKDNIRDLGVIVSHDLNFNEHKQDHNNMYGHHGNATENI